MVFRFGDHVLDIERRELRRGAEPVALEPQVFDLLVYLVRNRGRVVSKDDLIDECLGRADRLGLGIDDAPQCGAQGGRRQWRGAARHSHRAPQGRALYRRGE